MITSRTKKQLLVFIFITLVGVSYVGARYARLDRLFYNSSYKVNAEFSQSGGIFTGAEVTYRGVSIGQVSDMQLTRNGVDVVLSIDKSQSRIPANTMALVGNKSAVGEQYVELDPKVDSGPYLKDGSQIATADTQTPVSTTELLTNLDNLVNSVPQGDLRTVINEFGAAFKDTGQSLGQIIDTSNSFIKTANDNFDVTAALIKDANKVLGTQNDESDAIRTFSKDLALFSGTLAAHNKDLQVLIDNGAATASELRSFLETNKVNLGSLINNLVTTEQVTVRYLPGIQRILVLYPYLVAGATTVVDKGPTGYDAHFGLILTQTPAVCHGGYGGTDRRPPQDLADRPMKVNAACTEAATQSDPRGAQNAPRTGADYRAPVATYDHGTGKLTWSDQDPNGNVAYDGGANQLFGKDSFKWMMLQPLGSQE
ncbi:MAG: virulence factor Mce family protein [Marmoricola sp.]|nr:virulence factor Mce family protein [Marmoricola sp.]